VGCGVAKALLSRAGYTVEERTIGEDRGRQELKALGFDFVPVVVIGGRAFAGLPEDALRRELGLPVAELPWDRAKERVESTSFTLRTLLPVVPAIPNESWLVLMEPTRNRPLGQWVWHIFRFVEFVTESAAERKVQVEKLNEMSERRYWRQESQFRTFDDIARYGETMLQHLSDWAAHDLAGILDVPIDSPWGVITVIDLLDHLDRHSAVHFRQLLVKLGELRPDLENPVAPEALARIPTFTSLSRD